MPDPSCLCIDLRSAAQALTELYDGAMAAAGISVTQFSQLHLIRTLDGPTLTRLAAASGLERSTLGRNVRVLERRGLIRMQVGADARTRTIHLTRKGHAAYKRAVPLWHAVQRELLERLGGEGRDRLDHLLATLTAPLEELETRDSR